MRHEPCKVGLVEDDPIMGESLVQRLTLEGFDVVWWTDGKSALTDTKIRASDLGIMICDIRLPDLDGEQVFHQVAEGRNAPPFLFITAHADIDQAVRLMRSGAGDFIAKPFAMDELLTRMNAAIKHRPGLPGSPVLGVSRAMRDVEQTLRRLANHALPLLITGETGVGKEVAAQFLHTAARRGEGPFMAVNCAAIPAELLESEIFGHERGAFTGATARHLGYAERAQAGTLFLDEIGDMPLALQAKLLRLLEERSFTRVGGEALIPFRARVVAASNRELPTLIAAGQFREDLFFRLNALTVNIPALRERPEDVPWLIQALFPAAQAAERGIRGLGALAEEAALAHSWPGNVRELRNRLHRAAALGMGEWVMPGDLFPEKATQASADVFFPTLAEVRDAAERRQIERALGATEGQISESARMLGVSRTTLWEKMRRLRIESRN